METYRFNSDNGAPEFYSGGVRMVMSYADEETHLELFEHTCRHFAKDGLTNTGGIGLP
jgi:hypothetical protein